jgi:hypothetical protein
MMSLRWVIVLVLLNYCSRIPASSQQLQKIVAFPGAEGFGRMTSGGRGGEVLVVSNLNDSGPGSFRDAVQKDIKRIIVFCVSGYIKLKSPLNIENGNLTIAGQSSPGDGICITDYPVSVNADNVIIRYMRFRLGDESKQEADALGGIAGKENIMIDHCSMSWSTDECASFYRNKNFTMQWCIVSESLNQSVHTKGDHGYGGIWGGRGASFHHNLIASHSSRLPRFSGSSSTPNSPDELVDFANNVIYNWKDNSAYGGERGRYNIVNNYFKPGPATKSQKVWIVNPWQPYGKFFVEGNVVHNNEFLSRDNIKGIHADYPDSAFHASAFVVVPTSLQTAHDAYEIVLLRSGASLCRDDVDRRIVDEVRSGKSIHGKKQNGIIDSPTDVGGWPVLKSAEALKDSDRDGMPDEWERSKQLNPSDPNDAGKQTLQTGYDNIEVYLNSLIDVK